MSNQFLNIPEELRQLRQWVVWRLEKREGKKPTKVPYSPWPNGGKASVVNWGSWGTFDQAVAAPLNCVEPCDSSLPIEQTGFSGIGFVFTANDPYCGIDLDDTHGDQEAYQRQLRVFTEFNSYAELSPSGAGMHIIIKGSVPMGRHRADIEVYSKERYFTMTGNVQNNVPIAERQELLDILYEQMGGDPVTFVYGQEKEQTEDDEAIIARASSAVNGEKFNRLFVGDFQSLYPSQSEADFALIDIIAFYTQNSAQIARIFRSSALGQRDKAQRDDYIGYMVRKSFDKQLPPVDIDGLRIAIEKQMLSKGAAVQEPSGTAPAAPATTDHTSGQATALGALPTVGPSLHGNGESISHELGVRVNGIFPPGLLGEIAQFILDASPRPVPEISLAGAIALMSGITGRAYNISGAGLNQYILLLAMTGAGKDAISSGISKLMQQVSVSVPSAGDFKGPGQLVSGPGLIKWLEKKPSVVSIIGEIGLLLGQMSHPNASTHLKGLERTLLEMYSKSGAGQVFDPMAYSERDKNTASIHSPALTIIGESVPERFYEILDEAMIATGLLPRFMMFEYKGKREYLKEGTENIKPPFKLVQMVADLSSQCLTLAHNNNVVNIGQDNEAAKQFREFEKWTTDQINNSKSEVMRQLWNRAHLKALKLAGVCAVGINPFEPLVTIHETMWATDMVVNQTNRLIAKFETGAIGRIGGSENKQLNHIVGIISRYISKPYHEQPKAQIREDMHKAGVIPEAVISRQCICNTAFKNDKMGATNAIKRTLKILLDADELREVPKAQMQATFGAGPRAFVVANPARFVGMLEED